MRVRILPVALLAVLLAGLMVAPAGARRAHRSGTALPARGMLVRASYYRAPTRASFASRNRAWRGHTFAISYKGRTVHAVCRDYGPKIRSRDIDVSHDVASRLGFLRQGVVDVHIRRVR